MQWYCFKTFKIIREIRIVNRTVKLYQQSSDLHGTNRREIHSEHIIIGISRYMKYERCYLKAS